MLARASSRVRQHRLVARAGPARRRSSRGAGGAAAALVVLAPTEPHLAHLAALLAARREPGDCYLLRGAVGAGKSAFSRAFIRAAAGDPSLPVPSPTYLLQHIYDEQPGPPIHHFDLYRLQQQQGLARLDLPSSFDSAVCLVEWPERLPQQLLPQQCLHVSIEALEPGSDEQQARATSSHGGSGGGGGGGGGGGASQGLGCLGSAAPQLVVPLPAPDQQQQQLDWSDSESPGSSDGEPEEPDPFADVRWRRVELRADGPAWAERLGQLEQLWARLSRGGGTTAAG